MRVAGRRIRAGLWTVVALTAAALGIYIAIGGPGSPLKPYTLGETLPKMVADFGAQARIVQISYSEDNVDFQVIPRDGRLHVRNYDVVESEIDAGTTGYNRKVTDFVRAPTAAEAAQARVTLGQIDPGVADRLLHKVGFSRSDSSAILSGASWRLETYKGPSDDYVASFDGSSVHHGTATVGSPPASAPPVA